ncbi:unnamed protein product, partial [Rotaria sordida]
MLSRATLWRRKKKFKEKLCELVTTSTSSSNENWIHPLSADILSNNAEVDFSTQISTVTATETESDFFASVIDDEFEDEPDVFVHQTWLEENTNNIDPWKNVELESAFQFPIEENEILFHDIDPNPTEREIAAALVLLKVRHRVSNKCIDNLCKLLKLLKTTNCPINFSRVKRLFLPNSSPLPSSMITYLCPICCELSSSSGHCSNTSCTQHSSFTQSPFHYLRLPILPQLREILYNTCSINFEQQQRFSSSNDILNDIYAGKAYQNIIENQQGEEFLTFLMNVDGIQVANNSTTSLWIFTLVINEIKRTERFKLKNIIIGGIVSTTSKPTRAQMQSLLSAMVDELLLLEKGVFLEVKYLNYNVTKFLKCFLIASCCDKPAQSLVQGISEPTGAFGCGACELKGATVVINARSKKKIRVFPLIPEHQQQPRLRTNDTYDMFMKKYMKRNSFNYTELRDQYRGHKRLLRLWFDKKYRKQPWSTYGKENIVNRYLFSIKYPSTTVRSPRSLSKYEQYKANESRALLLFGFSGFCSVLPIKYAKHFLLLVVAVHIAESRRIHQTQIIFLSSEF